MAGLFFSYYNIVMKTLDLIHTQLFPTVIAHCVNVELASRLLPYANDVIIDHNSRKFNKFNYNNTYGIKLPDNIINKEFESFVSDVSYAYWVSIGIKEKISGITTFFSEMNEGGNHGIHSHPGSKLAGVFYLNASENSSKIRFHDPRPHSNFISYDFTGQSSLLYQHYDVTPYTGLFLVFPAWLSHEVLTNTSNNNRTTAVFNVF